MLWQRDFKWNVCFGKVRVVQHVRRAFFYGFAQVKETVEEDKRHVLPTDRLAVDTGLVECFVSRYGVGVAKERGGEFGDEDIELTHPLEGGAGRQVVRDEELSLKVAVVDIS